VAETDQDTLHTPVARESAHGAGTALLHAQPLRRSLARGSVERLASEKPQNQVGLGWTLHRPRNSVWSGVLDGSEASPASSASGALFAELADPGGGAIRRAPPSRAPPCAHWCQVPLASPSSGSPAPTARTGAAVLQASALCGPTLQSAATRCAAPWRLRETARPQSRPSVQHTDEGGSTRRCTKTSWRVYWNASGGRTCKARPRESPNLSRQGVQRHGVG
jgi:hypothetical protein